MDLTKCLDLEPDVPLAHHARAQAWQAQKRYDKALADYRKAATQVKETYGQTYFNSLAMFYACCPDARLRDGEKALMWATKADNAKLKGLGINPLQTIACAHAELGQFEKAVECQKIVVEVEKARKDQESIDLASALLKLFESGKPYRFEE